MLEEQTERRHAGVKQVTTLSELLSPQFPFSQRVRSMKSVFFAMLKTELGRQLRPCGGKIVLFLMLLCDRLPRILLLAATRNHIAFAGSRMSRASNNFCHAGRMNICSRSMSCQSCQLNGHSCSNPVLISTKQRAHAGVKQ